MKFLVKQVQITSEMSNRINIMGREAGLKIFPEYKTYMDLMCFGAKVWNNEMTQHFTEVAEVECKDLEDAFHILNNRSMFKNSYTQFVDSMRSLSVGDMLINKETNEHFLVDNFGFVSI